MSKLLLNEQPLIIMPQLAVKIGLNESLLLQQIHYWLEINKKADKNCKDGFYWTYNTYEEWQKQFPFWSIRTIRRIIASLESMKLVVASNYNKMKIDRTKWYRIDYKMLANIENMPCGQNDLMDEDNLTNTIPENKTEKVKTKTKYHHRKKNGDLSDYQLEATADLIGNELSTARINGLANNS